MSSAKQPHDPQDDSSDDRSQEEKHDGSSHQSPLNMAPNIALNLHPPSSRWEIRAYAASGILIQSGVLIYAGFSTYNHNSPNWSEAKKGLLTDFRCWSQAPFF